MISDLQSLFSATLALFKMEFTIYGFTFSWFQVMIFSLVADLIFWFLGRIFNE